MALLVALSLILLTIHYRESAGGVLHSLQRGAMEAIAPLQKGASKALKPIRDVGGWAGEVFNAKSENKKLRKRVEELESELAETATMERENEELKRLFNLKDEIGLLDNYEPVTATVITRSPTVWYSTVTIGKGRSSGVRENQPVISGKGLVGVVTSTSAHAAQVTLITDQTSAVSAQVVPGGAVGIVKPEIGDPDDLILDFVERDKKVRTGRTVVTAGWRSGKLESRFPRGLPIGRVSRVESGESDLTKRVHLRPFTDLRSIYIVQVLRAR